MPRFKIKLILLDLRDLVVSRSVVFRASLKMLAVLVVALVLLTRSAEANDEEVQGSTSSMNFSNPGNSTGPEELKTSAVLAAIPLNEFTSLSSVDLTRAAPLAEATPPTPAAAEPAPAPVGFDMTEYSVEDRYATQGDQPGTTSDVPGHQVNDYQMSTYSGEGSSADDMLYDGPTFASSDYQPAFYSFADQNSASYAGQDYLPEQYQTYNTLNTYQFPDTTGGDSPENRFERERMYALFAQKSRQAKARAKTYHPTKRYNAPSTSGAAWRPAKGTFYGSADASGTMGMSISLTTQ